MASDKFVSYLRVSTAKQGRSGLGIEAQRAAVAEHLKGGGRLVAEFVEVETGKRADRPQLLAAFKEARVYGATLLIAKLDRLSRDAHFLLGLEKEGLEFVCADMPVASRLTVGIMAMVAEEERKNTSKRTKDALAAARERGTKLGRPMRANDPKPPTVTPAMRAKAQAVRHAKANAKASDLSETIDAIRASGVTSARGIAEVLGARGIPTPRGGATWQAVQVQRILARANSGR